MSGDVGHDRVAVREYDREERVARALAAFGNGAVLALSMPSVTDAGMGRVWLAWLTSLSIRWQVVRSGESSQEVVGTVDGFPFCGALTTADAALCVETGRRGLRVWRAPARGMLRDIARLPRGYDMAHVADASRVVAASRLDVSQLALVDVGARRGASVRTRDDERRRGASKRWILDVTSAGDCVAVLTTMGRGGSEVTLYRLN